MSEQANPGKPNAQYNTATADSLALRATYLMRRRMYQRFIDVARPVAEEAILDVGVTSDREYASSNYLEAWYPHKRNITAAGVDDARFLETMYEGLRYVQADGKSLPFDDRSFDVVHSSAVLEHVGSREEQARFVNELLRVADRVVCLTTPNRWFPVEVHTSIPLLHWLPPRAYRALLRRMGLSFFAAEENLNLLGASELAALAAGSGAASWRIERMRLLGLTSNLMLFLYKRPR